VTPLGAASNRAQNPPAYAPISTALL
jgi:hypothetical protein